MVGYRSMRCKAPRSGISCVRPTTFWHDVSRFWWLQMNGARSVGKNRHGNDMATALRTPSVYKSIYATTCSALWRVHECRAPQLTDARSYLYQKFRISFRYLSITVVFGSKLVCSSTCVGRGITRNARLNRQSRSFS